MPILYILLSIIVIVTLLWSLKPIRKVEINANEKELKIVNKADFLVEIADSEYARQKGLMNRELLDEKKGMLFIFERNGIYPFWMKNTLIPLDIIWINEDKKIVEIYKDAKPCKNIVSAICESIIPTNIAKYVLEINSGLSTKYNLQIGDQLQF